MQLTSTDRNTLVVQAIIIACSTVGGGAFGLAMSGPDSPLYPASVMIGVYNGFLISLIITGFETHLFRAAASHWLNRSPFIVNLVLRTLIYLIVFALVMQSSFLVFDVEPEGWGWQGRDFIIAIGASFAAGITFNFIVRIDRMLGRGVLIRLITGYHHHPRVEERVFMFIDLVDSTATAERIGHVAFHRLLNDVICDATEPILAAQGDIHDYIGDEIIVTWTPGRGLGRGRCLQCFNHVRRVLEERRDTYVKAYGVEPRIRAALHMGKVVVGEVGLAKRDIVYLGDTVNTTARIEAACRKLGRDILISADVVDRLAGTAKFEFTDIGPIDLRGRSEPVRLYSLAT